MGLFDLIVGAVGGAVGSAVVAVLARSLLDSLLSRDLERFKAELKADYDVQLERHRADLRVSAAEREVRFSGLHERRLNTIAELYSLAWETWIEYQTGTLKFKRSDTEAFAPVFKRGRDFEIVLNQRRIWLPADVLAAFEAFVDRLEKARSELIRSTAGSARLEDESLSRVGQVISAALADLQTSVDGRIREALDGPGQLPSPLPTSVIPQSAL